MMVFDRIRKRRHRERCDPVAPLPKRQRSLRVKHSYAGDDKPSYNDDNDKENTEHAQRTPPRYDPSFLTTPPSARTLSPWASSSPDDTLGRKKRSGSKKTRSARKARSPLRSPDSRRVARSEMLPSMTRVSLEILEEEEEELRRRETNARPAEPGPARDESGLLAEDEISYSYNHSHLQDTSEKGNRDSVLSWDVSHNISQIEVSQSHSNSQSYDSLVSLTSAACSPGTSTDRIRYLLNSTTIPPSTTTHIMSLFNPLNKNITALGTANAKLEAQCSRLQETVDELEGENDQLREQNRRLMLERQVAQARASELEAELEKLSNRLALKGEKIVKLRGAVKKIVRM